MTENVEPQSDSFTLWHGDCLELMKDVPDGSVDMVLCDLPYGMTKNKWDCQIDHDTMWNHYWRLLKQNGIIALTASQPFTSTLWKNLHESLENALFAFRLGDRVGIMTGDIDGDGKPLLVGIERNAVMDRKPVNAIRSVYGLDNPGPWLQNQFKSGEEYIPLNKQRADAFLQTYGYMASVGDGIRSLDGTVTQNEPESKGKFSLKTPVEDTTVWGLEAQALPV